VAARFSLPPPGISGKQSEALRRFEEHWSIIEPALIEITVGKSSTPQCISNSPTNSPTNSTKESTVPPADSDFESVRINFSRNETESCNQQGDDQNKQHVLTISNQLLQVFDLTYWDF
jgi:hypothetical protein